MLNIYRKTETPKNMAKNLENRGLGYASSQTQQKLVLRKNFDKFGHSSATCSALFEPGAPLFQRFESFYINILYI